MNHSVPSQHVIWHAGQRKKHRLPYTDLASVCPVPGVTGRSTQCLVQAGLLVGNDEESIIQSSLSIYSTIQTITGACLSSVAEVDDLLYTGTNSYIHQLIFTRDPNEFPWWLIAFIDLYMHHRFPVLFREFIVRKVSLDSFTPNCSKSFHTEILNSITRSKII